MRTETGVASRAAAKTWKTCLPQAPNEQTMTRSDNQKPRRKHPAARCHLEEVSSSSSFSFSSETTRRWRDRHGAPEAWRTVPASSAQATQRATPPLHLLLLLLFHFPPLLLSLFFSAKFFLKRSRKVRPSMPSADASANDSTPKRRVSLGECRWMRSLLCGTGSARLPGRTPGSGVFCLRGGVVRCVHHLLLGPGGCLRSL